MGILKWKPASGRKAEESEGTVLLIHGLERLPCTMTVLEWRFRKAGWNVIQYIYPCHEISFYRARDVLRKLLRELPENQTPTHAIGFSMGGVILSELLRDDPLFPRAILLGSPLLHSQAAAHTLRVPLSRNIFGPSLEELAEERELSLPETIEIAAIAGYGPVRGSWNPLLEGENDGIVRVAEAIPHSIEHTRKLSAPHIGLVLQPTPFSLMHHFLQSGTLPEE